MNTRLKKISTYFVLIFFIISNFGAYTLYAKNEKKVKIKKEFVLKDNFQGKKLEKIKKSVKGKTQYKFVIKSDKKLHKIQSQLQKIDKKIKIKKVGKNKFKIKVPVNSIYAYQFKEKVDKGIFPTQIGDFDTIEPEIVEAFSTHFLEGEENDKLWGLSYIGADTFQEDLSSIQKIKVGILDTGIDYTHTDLDDNYNTSLSYDFVNEDTDAIDDNGHGTSVAGVIGSEVNGSGRYGVNSNADLVGLKVLDLNGYGTSYDILEAISYAKENNIKVLNMSFGGTGTPESSSICEAITYAKESGIISVVSAGNNSADVSTMIPAGCSDAVVVGSMNQEGHISSFSNTGSGVIYAPGENIYTTGLNGNYATQNGTSLATAFVSGLISKELALNDSIGHSTIISNIENNYNLYIPENTQGSTKGSGSSSTDSSSSGSSISPIIDYTNYKYYDGIFQYDGKIYGNSLYDNSQDFSGTDLSSVTTYSYEDYQAFQRESKGDFQMMTVPISSIKGQWDLNGDVNDSSGNNDHATPNDISWNNTNGDNQTANFNGSSSYMTLPNGTINNQNSFWLNLWIKPDSIPSSGNYWIFQGTHSSLGGSDGIRLLFNQAGNCLYFTIDDGVNHNTCISLNDISTTEYQMITGVFDVNNDNLYLYLNGELKDSLTTDSISTFSTTYNRFGSFTNGISDFPGDIGLIKYGTNIVLSQSEITSLYHEGQEKILGVDPGIYAHWDLNGNANDSSGNGNNATPYGVTWVSSGKGDGKQVANLDGSDYISNGTFGVGSGGYSICADIKTSTTGSYQVIENQYDYTGNNRSYILRINNNNKAYFFVSSDGSSTSTEGVESSATVTDGNWHHVCGVFNGGGIPLDLYIDGSVDNGSRSGTTQNQIYNNNQAHYIGRDGHGLTSMFNGQIGKVRIYKEPLSSSEVSNLYNYGSINPTITNETEEPQNNTSHSTSTDTTAEYDSTDIMCHMDESNKGVFKVTKTETQQAKDEGNEGDPVQLSTGKFTYNNTFMSIPGEKIPYELSLNYHNQTYYNGPVGINWDHNYNIYLDEEANGNVIMYNGKLGIFRFIKNGSIFEYNQGLRATLVDTAGIYTVEFDNGDIYAFDSTINRISKLEDRYGNDLLFTYTGNLLSKVTDTLGRDITYNYYAHKRLQDVTDFNGRKVEFSYYDTGSASGSIYDLQTVTINNGIDATKTIDFEYTVGGDTTSNHNITKLIDSKGQTYVTNTYDTGDRVTSQVFGNGTISYTYTLDGSDNITKNTVIDRLGNKTEYNYDINHNNISTKYFDENGVDSVSYVYEYNTDGYVTKEVRPKGNGYTYSYDSKGNLLEKKFKADITLADSNNDLVTSYTYNSLNQILTTTHPNGIIETNTIDGNGNITSKQVSGLTTHSGATYSSASNYTYLTGGLVDTITDGEGNITDFNYGSGQVVEIVKGTGALSYTGSFVYNDYGNILSSTDGEGFTKTFDLTDFNLVSTGTTAEGIVTSYEYDVNNNKTKETKYLTGGLEISTYYTYDILDNLVTEVQDTASDAQLTTSYTYDANDRLIEKQVGNGSLYKYNYDAFGNLEEERIIMNPLNSAEDIVTAYTYDDNNNLVSKTDPEGNVTSYTYDLYDRLIKETNAEGTYSSFGYNKDGSISSKNIYNSGATLLSKTEYFYDGLGNIVNEIKYLDPVNSTGAVSNKVVYNLNGKEIEIIDGKGNSSFNNYDSLGRLSESTDALGNKVLYGYDKRDLVVSQSIIPNTGTGIVTTTSLYDNDGRKISETNNLGNTKILNYNELNQVISSTDEEDNTTNLNLDYLGNITSETKYLSGSTVTKSYTYDERSNLLFVTDGEGNVTNYEYDGINRNTKVIYVDGKELVYEYDKNSNLVSQTDPNGSVVTSNYDSLNRLSSRSISTGTGVLGITSESYIYDDLGRLVSGSDNNLNTLDFEYDSLGRLTKEIQNSGTGVSYTYDTNNNLSKIIHPDLRETVYTYDDLNRNTTVSFSGELIASYSFTGVLNDSISYGNGKNISMGHDDLLRLASLDNGVKAYTYSYDKVSNITSDSFKDYIYDDIYRVVGVNNTASGTSLESFNYDDAGNRISDDFYDYTTNTLNQYTSFSGSTNRSFVYDNNGNIVDNGEYAFEYDYKNRLLKVSTGSTVVSEYIYDVLGRRIEKSVDGEVISYIYSDKNILEEIKTKASRTFKKAYINGVGLDNLIAFTQEEPDLSIAEQGELDFCTARVIPYSNEFNTYSWNAITSRCDTLSQSGSVIVENMYYFHKNHLGSVVGITDESGNIISEYDYDVFGKATLISGDNIGNTRLYTGRELDSETELYFLRARYYDSEIGRFISRDPIGQIDDVNLYVYVGNNSVMFVDLMGLEKALLMILDRFNYYGTYFENLYSFNTHKIFTEITLNPKKGNIKLNKDIREKAVFIDDNWTTEGSGKKIIIDGKNIWLADIGNILYAYNGTKAGYGITSIKAGAFAATSRAYDQGYKQDGIVKNELEDWKFYEAGKQLASSTEYGNITRKDLLNTYFSIFPDGR